MFIPELCATSSMCIPLFPLDAIRLEINKEIKLQSQPIQQIAIHLQEGTQAISSPFNHGLGGHLIANGNIPYDFMWYHQYLPTDYGRL